MINELNNITKIIRYLIKISCIFFMFYSCDQKIVYNTKKNKNIPSRKIFNAKIISKDSAEINYILTAPLIEEYGFLQNPVSLFRKGINIEFYKKNAPYKGILRADYAKIIESKNWYQAKGNVYINTPDGDTITTKTLYLDKNQKKFFTKDTVRIARLDKSVIYANKGIEACEDFSCYKLYNNHNSEILVKD